MESSTATRRAAPSVLLSGDPTGECFEQSPEQMGLVVLLELGFDLNVASASHLPASIGTFAIVLCVGPEDVTGVSRDRTHGESPDLSPSGVPARRMDV